MRNYEKEDRRNYDSLDESVESNELLNRLQVFKKQTLEFAIQMVKEQIKENKPIEPIFAHLVLSMTKENAEVMKQALEEVYTPSTRLRSKFQLMYISIIGRMGGEKTREIVKAADFMKNFRQNEMENANAILEGVKITSNNLIPENMSVLLEQIELMDRYNEASHRYIAAYEERCIKMKSRNFYTPIELESQEELASCKEKIKSLREKYSPTKKA